MRIIILRLEKNFPKNTTTPRIRRKYFKNILGISIRFVRQSGKKLFKIPKGTYWHTKEKFSEHRTFRVLCEEKQNFLKKQVGEENIFSSKRKMFGKKYLRSTIPEEWRKLSVDTECDWVDIMHRY